jgi:hypothetical protein
VDVDETLRTEKKESGTENEVVEGRRSIREEVN